MFDLMRIDPKERFEGACMDNRSIRCILTEAIAQIKRSECPAVISVDTVLHFGNGTMEL